MTNTFDMELHLQQATKNMEELCKIAEQNHLMSDQQIQTLNDQTQMVNQMEQHLMDHFNHMNMMIGGF